MEATDNLKGRCAGPGATRDGRRGVRALAMSFAVALMAVAPFAFSPATAVAGTNGQQVYVCSSHSGYVQLYGENQNNKYVTSPWGYVQAGGCEALPNWWWKYTIKITFVRSTGGTYVYSANVPVSQASNWFGVYLP